MQVGISIKPTATDLDVHSASNLFGQAMLAIGQSKNGFDMAALPFTFQSSDPRFSTLVLNFDYPNGSSQQMTWAMVYQLMLTCQNFYILSPQAPAKEILFRVQSADSKSWGEGEMVVVQAKRSKGRRRQYVANWRKIKTICVAFKENFLEIWTDCKTHHQGLPKCGIWHLSPETCMPYEDYTQHCQWSQWKLYCIKGFGEEHTGENYS